MTLPSPLSLDELVELCQPDRPYAESTRLMQAADGRDELIHQDGLGSFEKCLRLKLTLDVFEEEAQHSASWVNLAILLNCEYLLYELNKSTPLRINPFLSHWVEAAQRFSHASAKTAKPKDHRQEQQLDASDINAARVEMIALILQTSQGSSEGLSTLSPSAIHEMVCNSKQAPKLDLEPYIRMLEEEGIYEKNSLAPPILSMENLEESVTEGAETTKAGKSGVRVLDWKDELRALLRDDLIAAVSELTHLPLELTYLDFLTTLLMDKTLENLSIEPLPVVCDYIQHALRQVEHMVQSPRNESTDPFADQRAVASDGTGSGAQGRDAQIRGVKLLLLFIRNLVRRALVDPGDLYFEIQEICVRYVWIKEVREFRAFIEKGSEGTEWT
ncbi:hypothetical protein P154DRAFT_554000 [Amniculicola lignicola CBS 123094]|uniref:Uncharacterized protein n=1 Tax=Amniculicola lignicola CBS 123094 TaxID=1392246 RepID=A0A6A5WIV5_9PLEO|nr:hypothetical protein P154DRAFT_554000 [Amniculicola lignicola CBS 123094]